MFDKLPPDIIYSIIINFTNIHDIINLSIINKDTYTIFDDYIYMYWGRYIYTNDFWEKPQQRSPKVSRPLLNMKLELIRINNFTTYCSIWYAGIRGATMVLSKHGSIGYSI